MTYYLVRHGRDDDSVRGGWSSSPLTEDGVKQVENLASRLLVDSPEISTIYTSDLPRARQTADILAKALNLPVVELPQFRETNNGVLAGIDNEKAKKHYPGLYWSALEWEQPYPDGESPRDFFERRSDAWRNFKEYAPEESMLVTHGGVINVIRCIESGIRYSNKENPYPAANAEMIGIEI